MSFLLTGFHSLSPRFRFPQKESLEWLAQAHAKAEESLRGEGAGDPSPSDEKIKERVARFCCGPESIGKRGSELADFSHHDWERMDLFPVRSSPRGVGVGARNDFYHRTVQKSSPNLSSHKRRRTISST
jgi:hypothetical protein